MAMEDEIAALRCAIEEVSAQYIGATQQFANAVNRLAEILVEGKATLPATAGPKPEPKPKPEPEPEPEPEQTKPAKAKKTKVKAKKAEPEPEPEPEKKATSNLTAAAVREKLVEVIAAGGIQEATEAMARIVGAGTQLETVPPGDERLEELLDFATKYLAGS
jgi:outer membrane biosynthesis protein TonB